MLTTNSPISELLEFLKICDKDIVDELGFYLCEKNVTYKRRSTTRKLLEFMSKKGKVIGDILKWKNSDEESLILVVDLSFRTRVSKYEDKNLMLTFYFDDEKWAGISSYRYYQDPGPFDEYQKYMNIVNENLKRFLN